jgi:hypothetical protein
VPDPSIKDLAYRGLASVLGGPVDISTMLLRPFGYTTPDEQVFGGSEWIGQKMQDAGLVSSARSPVKEFLSSLAMPTPSGMAKGAALASTALIKPINPGKLASGVQKTVSKVDSATNPIKEGFTRLFHAGSDPIKGGFFDKVPSGGVFDGFFALPGRYGAYGTGAKYYADVANNMVLKTYDLNYDIPYEKVSKALEDVSGIKSSDSRFDGLWEAVVEDKADKVDLSNVLNLSSSDSIGDAILEAQRLRGRLAKKLGYDAVEMADENGTSYLITSGTKLNRDVDDVAEQVAKEQPKIELFPTKKASSGPVVFERRNRKGEIISKSTL